MTDKDTDEKYNPQYDPANPYYNELFNNLDKAENKSATGGRDDDKDGKTDLNADEEKGSGIINNVTGRDGKSKGGKKGALIKKLAPLITAGVLTVAGLLAGLVGLGPGLLLNHVKETFFNKLNDAGPGLHIRSHRMMVSKFRHSRNNVRNSFTFSSEGKCNLRCRHGTINSTLKNNLEAKGFILDVEEGPGVFKNRFQIKEAYFPSGTRVSNGADFMREINGVGRNASDFRRVFNSKTAYYMNSNFGKMIKKKFGIDKFTRLTGKWRKNAKDALTNALRKILGLSDVDPNNRRPSLGDRIKGSDTFKKLKTKVEKFEAKFTKVNDWVGGICAVYNFGRAVTYSVKAAKIAALASFAMIFLNAADEIKAGEADPEVVSMLGNQLTQLDENGKSATDSFGYKSVAYGDTGSASEQQKKYSATISDGIGGVALGALGAIGVGALGFMVFKKLCRTATHVLGDIANCFGQGGAATFGLSCIVMTLVTVATVSAAVSKGIQYVVGKISENALPALDENTVGEDMGNAYYTGSAQIMGGAAAGYGLNAGSKEEIEQYTVDTSEARAFEKKIAIYEAKETPFDIYNQYSFLGLIANNIGLNTIVGSSNMTSYANNLLSIIPRSVNLIGSVVSADSGGDYKKASRYTNCDDGNLRAIGVDGDPFCNPSYVMSSNTLNKDVDDVVEFMTNPANNSGEDPGGTGKGFVDEDGKVIKNGGREYINYDPTNWYTAKTDYENYLDNCANRVVPLGETEGSIESEYFEWEIGLNCTNPSEDRIKNELPYFQAFTMDYAITETMEEDLSKVTGDGGASTTTTTGPAGSTADPAYDSKTAQELAKIILDSGNVVDQSPGGQLTQILNNNWTQVPGVNVHIKVLKILANLSKTHKFAISSLVRTGSGRSQHYSGQAVDIGGGYGIDGVVIPNFSDVNQTIQNFINDTISLLGSDCHQIGIPNQTYVNQTEKKQCDSVIVDDPDTTGASGPHVHIGIKAD